MLTHFASPSLMVVPFDYKQKEKRLFKNEKLIFKGIFI